MESYQQARISINKCQIVVVNEENLSFYLRKFICSENNKASIITLISKYSDDQRVIKCNRDDDKTVASEALSLTQPQATLILTLCSLIIGMGIISWISSYIQKYL